MALTLFHYWRSSSSWRLRWALELKGIECKKVAVNLLAGEEKLPEYLARNPAGYVPCLVVGDRVLAESMAIMEWLEETYPQAPLLPGDSFQRAFIRQLAETVNSGIQPLHNLEVIKRVSPEKEAQAAWVNHWVSRGLEVYERLLADSKISGKKFSVSDDPTLADLCLIPVLYTAQRFNVNTAAFPRCESIYQHALTTAACAASRPEAHQPA
jgi:maleylacetoacetate isomerase